MVYYGHQNLIDKNIFEHSNMDYQNHQALRSVRALNAFHQWLFGLLQE